MHIGTLYNKKIKTNPVDLKSDTYIDFDVRNNNKDPKFKVSYHVKISKYKSIFAEGYTSKWWKEVFIIKEFKILCHEHM